MTTHIDPIVTPQGYVLQQHPNKGGCWQYFSFDKGGGPAPGPLFTLTTEEAHNLHIAAAMLGCDSKSCPCRMDGVEIGLQIPREPFRLEA